MKLEKIGYVVPVNIVGQDEEGRTLVRCPSPGCGETATVLEDGRISCPVGEAEDEALRQAMPRLLESLER